MKFDITEWTQPNYSFSAIGEIFGYNRNTLQDWMLRGYIIPTKEACGRGKTHFYSKLDLFQAMLFRHLIDIGLSREKSIKIASFAKDIVQSNLENEEDVLNEISYPISSIIMVNVSLLPKMIEVDNKIKSFGPYGVTQKKRSKKHEAE